MTFDAASGRALCLAMPGAELDHPFSPETDVFRVGGKVFAMASLGDPPRRLTLKAEPERGAELRAEHSTIGVGYHMDHRHWITVDLDAAVPEALLRELVEDSYDLVRAGLTRRVRDALPSVSTEG